MKKLMTLFLLSALCSVAIAQKAFKPIAFNAFQETTWKPMEFNSESSGPYNRVTGVINVNLKDSVIMVTPQGQNAISYKILESRNEEEDKKLGAKTIMFLCKDSEGKACDAKIVRTKDGASKYTKISFIYHTYLIAYFSDYIKNLYL